MAKTLEAFKVAQRDSEESTEVAEDVTIPIEDPDGTVRNVTFQGPNSTETTMLLMATSSATNILQGVAGCLDLILGLIDDEFDRRWMESRLRDRKDPFKIEDVTDIVLLLIEEWFTRPTQKQQNSSGSGSPTGKKSTASRHRKASAHSTSPRTDS